MSAAEISIVSFLEQLKDKVKEVYTIGDAKSFRRIMKAIAEGYTTGLRIYRRLNNEII